MHRGSARSSLGRVARVAGAVVLGLLALAAAAVSAAFIYARTEVGREQVRQLVLGQARAHVPGLRIGHVGGDYVHDLILDDVSVVDDSGRTAVAVARLSARYDLLALLRHTVAVRELRVEGARLVVRPEADGTLNVQHLVAPSAAPASPKSAHPPGGASGRWRVRLDRLAVVDLAADARLADGSRAIVSALDLSARLALDADRLNARLDELEIRSGPAGRITAQGSASVDHLGGAQPRLGDYELAVQAENLDPAALLSRAPAARLGFSLSLDGHGLPLAEDAAAQLAL
ncbi:MAG TPA: hypothetical protein VMU50_09980, partial [Polyangia bacterium]|nr:hypothetical protein [Polyangia bacterium]